jgi:hypothetical protein
MPDLGTAGAALSVASGVKSLFGGSESSSAAGGASDAAIIAAQTQAEVAAKQEKRNDEQWARFKEQYWPLEDELLDPANRNVQDRSEERAADAGDAVSTSFSAQRGQTRRALERAGVNPADGKFRGMERGYDLSEAALRADSMNDARAAERARVEDTNFNRALQVMSLGRNIPAQVGASSAFSGAAYGNNASVYSNLAKMLAQDAGSAASGGIQAISRGLDGLSKSGVFNEQTTVPEYGTPEYQFAAENMFEKGGVVRGPSHARGGVDIEAEGGEYVLPVEVVQDIGVHRIEKMVADAKKRIAERRSRGHRPPQAMRRD